MLESTRVVFCWNKAAFGQSMVDSQGKEEAIRVQQVAYVQYRPFAT